MNKREKYYFECVFSTTNTGAGNSLTELSFSSSVYKLLTFLQKKSLASVKNLVGYDAAEKVYEFFRDNTNHPHPLFTFRRLAMNRDMREDHTSRFAKRLAFVLAELTAENMLISFHEKTHQGDKSHENISSLRTALSLLERIC